MHLRSPMGLQRNICFVIPEVNRQSNKAPISYDIRRCVPLTLSILHSNVVRGQASPCPAAEIQVRLDAGKDYEFIGERVTKSDTPSGQDLSAVSGPSLL